MQLPWTFLIVLNPPIEEIVYVPQIPCTFLYISQPLLQLRGMCLLMSYFSTSVQYHFQSKVLNYNSSMPPPFLSFPVAMALEATYSRWHISKTKESQPAHSGLWPEGEINSYYIVIESFVVCLLLQHCLYYTDQYNTYVAVVHIVIIYACSLKDPIYNNPLLPSTIRN